MKRGLDKISLLDVVDFTTEATSKYSRIKVCPPVTMTNVSKLRITLTESETRRSVPLSEEENPLFFLIMPTFYDPPSTWPEAETLLEKVTRLLISAKSDGRDLVNSVNELDVFDQRNTLAHYIVFFLGGYVRHETVGYRFFVALLRLLVFEFGCNISLPNANGSTVLSFALKWKTLSRRIVFSICREKIDAEKRTIIDLLSVPDPIFSRCGMIPDMQRELKLRVLQDRVKATTELATSGQLFKLIALQELRRTCSFTESELIVKLLAPTTD